VSYPQAVVTIETFVLANWTATPVKFPGTAFAEPPNAPHVALTMLENTLGGPITTGNVQETQLYRFPGFITGQVFGIGNGGRGPILTLADQWLALFGKGVKTFAISPTERLACVAGNIIEVGQSNDRYQVNVTIEYQRDEYAQGG